MNSIHPAIGPLLRSWREKRRLSQLDLACEANISTKHLSFLETGRSKPSREMILLLSEQLEVPLRERNELLLAAGYAPAFTEHALDHSKFQTARQVIDLILKGHEPFPALAVNRHWEMVSANSAITALLEGVSPQLLEPPVNVLRLSLHPEGLSSRIANLSEWRVHLLERLRHQIDRSQDVILKALYEELAQYPVPDAEETVLDSSVNYAGLAVPFQLKTDTGVLSYISTTTVFGTPVDVTLSEIAIEAFFPVGSDKPALIAAK